MMRYPLSVLLTVILCSIAVGQEYAKPSAIQSTSPTQFSNRSTAQVSPHPNTQTFARPMPSCDKIEQLLKKAAHLEAAGRHEDAVKFWQDAYDELKAVKKELESLQAEVSRLHENIRDKRQVMIQIKAIELSQTKLRGLGITFPPEGTVQHNNASTVADSTLYGVIEGDTKLFYKTLDALQKDNLVRILGEPTLVTVSGHTASFMSGGEIPIPMERDGKTTTEYKPYGTEVDFAPTILSNGNLKIDLRARFSDLDLQHTIQVQNVTIPGIKSRQVSTCAELRPGQTLVIRGLAERREAEKPKTATEQSAQDNDRKADPEKMPTEEIELCVIVKADIVEVLNASPTP